MGQSLFQVQPGQSKTIAYKQVSYQYNKTLDGKPIGKSGYLIYLLWMDQAHFPLAPNLSFKRIASIFDSKYGRIPISDRYWNDVPSNLVRNEAGNRKPEDFEMKKKRGKERKKRERNAVVWMKSFLPDMHSYEPSGVFARNRAQALARFKRTVEGRGLWPLSCRSF